MFFGGFTARYTVEGQKFYGVDVSKWFPYALLHAWHVQSPLFWTATGFLAAGRLLAPLIGGGKDRKLQTLGVDVLCWTLVAVVVGSIPGNCLAITQLMPAQWNF